MPDPERLMVVDHPLDPHGVLDLRTVRGTVRVRGTDGSVCHLEARYRLPGGIDPAADARLDGVVRIEPGDGGLRVEVVDRDEDRSLAAGLGRLFRGGRPSVDFEILLPRLAGLRLSGVTAELTVAGVQGDQELQTVSGAARIEDAAGKVVVKTVSADVRVQGTTLNLDGSSTSGELSVEAQVIDLLHLTSVSGDIQVIGRLSGGPRHSIESVSGQLTLTPLAGVTVSMRGLSGSIRSNAEVRRETHDGSRVAVIGDGVADVQFRTISGDLVLIAPPPARQASMAVAPATASTPAGEPSSSPPVAADVVDATPAETIDQLAVLRALERGDIDVDEAAQRLSRMPVDA